MEERAVEGWGEGLEMRIVLDARSLVWAIDGSWILANRHSEVGKSCVNH